MHTEVTAFQRIITKPHPLPIQPAVRPIQETRSTHAASCPHCGSEVRVKADRQADVFGACVHLQAIHQAGGAVTVVFEGT